MKDDTNSAKLSVEQQFSIASFCNQVDRMSEEQAKALLKTVYEQMMLKDIAYQKLLKGLLRID